MTDFNSMIDALVSCDTDKVVQLVNTAVAEGLEPKDILNNGLIAGMDIVGEKMKNSCRRGTSYTGYHF